LNVNNAFATISAFLVLFATMLDPEISLILAVVLFIVYVVMRATRLPSQTPQSSVRCSSGPSNK
jgi:flagellar biogenesis protein FliO